MLSTSQDSHLRTVYTRFRACSEAHRDRPHPECSNCIIHGDDVVCSNPDHRDGDCPVCDLIEGRLAEVSPIEEIKLVQRVRNHFDHKGH